MTQNKFHFSATLDREASAARSHFCSCEASPPYRLRLSSVAANAPEQATLVLRCAEKAVGRSDDVNE